MEDDLSSSSQKEKEKEANIEDHEILKKKISTHPLYGLLVENHLDCLKVSGINGELEENDGCRDIKQLDYNCKANLGVLGHSDLDHFMEAYCLALGKLKAAMEEPQQKSMEFITNMQVQLEDLTNNSHLPDQPAPASLSGES
ncbi:homeobox protein knotted-1-like 1 [Malus sylvestris]|uniref:homeobox protein knotted-1-like 1 n=1 Tax=Malus sylvestris TaxID=3752 RepID=UPI000498A338|nr:homeobox protein knotted-1-like 1 [Malus domestica]XP_050152111.1 homeobox protein knotted-1-like 1 [Malus sylvestris]